MATFTSPCQNSVLSKGDAAPMPTLIKSTYLIDYISAEERRILNSKRRHATKALDSLSEAAGKRVFPTTFDNIYRSCISAAIGETLELEFQEDTPDWKIENRNAAAKNWIRPLAERREFVATQKWNLRKNKS